MNYHGAAARRSGGLASVGYLRVLASLSALVLLALVVANGFWRVFVPEPEPRTPPRDPDRWAPLIGRAHLFGEALRSDAPVSAANPATAATVADIRLVGVFAERDGRGAALLRVGGQPSRLYRIGDEVAPGQRLARVEARAIELIDSGGQRRIELPSERSSPTGAPGSRPPPAPGGGPPGTGAPAAASVAAAASMCARPANFAGGFYLLRAELLEGMIRQPASWQSLVRAAGSALVVTDSSGFAAMLGLQAGDRIERANGVALGGADDIVRQVLQPLATNQRVTLAGQRDGAPREWLYVNASACSGPAAVGPLPSG